MRGYQECISTSAARFSRELLQAYRVRIPSSFEFSLSPLSSCWPAVGSETTRPLQRHKGSGHSRVPRFGSSFDTWYGFPACNIEHATCWFRLREVVPSWSSVACLGRAFGGTRVGVGSLPATWGAAYPVTTPHDPRFRGPGRPGVLGDGKSRELPASDLPSTAQVHLGNYLDSDIPATRTHISRIQEATTNRSRNANETRSHPSIRLRDVDKTDRHRRAWPICLTN
jgi:hypothetical protein